LARVLQCCRNALLVAIGTLAVCVTHRGLYGALDGARSVHTFARRGVCGERDAGGAFIERNPRSARMTNTVLSTRLLFWLVQPHEAVLLLEGEHTSVAAETTDVGLISTTPCCICVQRDLPLRQVPVVQVVAADMMHAALTYCAGLRVDRRAKRTSFSPATHPVSNSAVALPPSIVVFV
jgi:hypothetical protein